MLKRKPSGNNNLHNMHAFGVIFFFFEPSNEDPKEPVPVATLPCLSTKSLYQKVMTSDVTSSAAACEMLLA